MPVLLYVYRFCLCVPLCVFSIPAKARVSPNHTMDAAAAASLSASSEWQAVVQLTGNLSLLNLTGLVGDDNKVFFYANILNLLLAHTAITMHSVWPADGAARVLLLKTSSYYLGQLGIVR